MLSISGVDVFGQNVAITSTCKGTLFAGSIRSQTVVVGRITNFAGCQSLARDTACEGARVTQFICSVDKKSSCLIAGVALRQALAEIALVQRALLTGLSG